jgi:phosphate transport system substrate-binding protein
LTGEQLKKAGDVMPIPLVMGGVVPAYNVKEVTKHLHFTGPVLADIYLGAITKWNDDKLKEINPGVELPDQEITVVHRAEASGTTYIWTEYLAQVSPAWKDKVGSASLMPQWPAGTAAKGNDGVAGVITQTPGALGYVELTYALASKLKYGAVKNRESKFVLATPDGVTAAARAVAKTSDHLSASLIDAPGEKAYPICGTTYAVFSLNGPNGHGRQVAEFIHWVTGEGQRFARDMHYAPLPKELTERVGKKLASAKEE